MIIYCYTQCRQHCSKQPKHLYRPPLNAYKRTTHSTLVVSHSMRIEAIHAKPYKQKPKSVLRDGHTVTYNELRIFFAAGIHSVSQPSHLQNLQPAPENATSQRFITKSALSLPCDRQPTRAHIRGCSLLSMQHSNHKHHLTTQQHDRTCSQKSFHMSTVSNSKP